MLCTQIHFMTRDLSYSQNYFSTLALSSVIFYVVQSLHPHLEEQQQCPPLPNKPGAGNFTL